MKHFIVILFLLAFFHGFGQKKKKTDPKDEQIDTLTKANTRLSGQLDSISRKYNTMYTTIKDKVLLKDYQPDELSRIIDSIRASRDSASFLKSAPLRDSLSMMVKENKMLKAHLDSLTVGNQKMAADSADKAKLMAELKDLKSLLDAKIINQAEFDAKKKIIMEKWK